MCIALHGGVVAGSLVPLGDVLCRCPYLVCFQFCHSKRRPPAPCRRHGPGEDHPSHLRCGLLPEGVAAPGGGAVICALHLGAGRVPSCRGFNEVFLRVQVLAWVQGPGSLKILFQSKAGMEMKCLLRLDACVSELESGYTFREETQGVPELGLPSVRQQRFQRTSRIPSICATLNFQNIYTSSISHNPVIAMCSRHIYR